MYRFIYFVAVFFLFSACNNKEQETIEASNKLKPVKTSIKSAQSVVGLDKIWYQGKAELNRFELEQNRYREIHPGELVLIFVTEDFLTDKQVKNDNYRNPNSIPILKTNMLRKFTTGIYDYSIMTSVFTPTNSSEFPNTLKVTSSSQDWCGHTFMQLNQRKEGLNIELRSYFESEGDLNELGETALLEDEIFNRIRMNPEGLPTGAFKMYPSTTYARLAHKPFKPTTVDATLKNYEGKTFKGDNLKVYEINFSRFRRTLSIVFSGNAPYRIEGWEESSPSAFDGQIRTSTARRTSSEWIDYWSKNSMKDLILREKIGMEAMYK